MYYIKSAESVGIKVRRATRPVLGLGQRFTQRGRSRVVEVVVKVGVRDGVASLGPVEEGVPAVGEQSVGAATEYVNFGRTARSNGMTKKDVSAQITAWWKGQKGHLANVEASKAGAVIVADSCVAGPA